MPEFLERLLKRTAAAKGLKGRKAAQYTYGALNNMGAMRGNQETAKGAEIQEKHERKIRLKDLMRKGKK